MVYLNDAENLTDERLIATDRKVRKDYTWN